MFKTRAIVLFAAAFAVAGVLIMAGCGSSGGSNGYGPGYGSSGGSTPTTSTTQAVSIHTASAMVNGKSVTILTDASGKTLYYFTPDSATTAACTSSCTSTWPPLLSSSGSPTSTATLPGTLGVISDANGSQVVYNGHPLYTFSGDTAAGMTNGEGVLGKWFVATTDLAAQSGTSGGAPTPTAGGYYH